jgi:hypothetical protein
MEGAWNGEVVRLGRRDWIGGADDGDRSRFSEVWLRIGTAPPGAAVRILIDDDSPTDRPEKH